MHVWTKIVVNTAVLTESCGWVHQNVLWLTLL